MSDLGTPLTIILDATANELPGLNKATSEGLEGVVTAVGGIPDGTDGGHAAVAVVTTLPDGSTVMGQTTLALLANATRALAARYPDTRP